jgi:hypothetical protein
MAIFELITMTFRNRIVLTSSLLAFTLAAHAQEAQKDAPTGMKGIWIIKSIYQTQNVQGPSPTEQKQLVGSEVVYGDRTLTSCGQSVPITSVNQHRVVSAEFLANNNVRFSEVDIHTATVKEVVLNFRQAGTCLDGFPLPGQDVYLKSKDEIVIAFEGVFYRVVRKK